MRASVAVLGLWHLGLVTSACLAEIGVRVVVHDADPAVTAMIGAGASPVWEPGLVELLAEQRRAGRLVVEPDLAAAVGGRSVVWLCFDTPLDDHDRADTAVLHETAAAVAACASGPFTLVVSSQVPVGTCRRLAAVLPAGSHVAYVMENLQLGVALDRFRRPDVLVVGSDGPAAAEVVLDLLRSLPGDRVVTDLESAEMTKHAINAFLGTSISLANEIGDLCAAVGADGHAVARAMRLDRRIGERARVTPGLGFAGGTLARDLRFLERLATEVGLRPTMAPAALQVNAGRLDALLRAMSADVTLAGGAVAVLGVSYKAGSDVLRRSPGLELAARLHAAGAVVHAYDPLVPARSLPPAPGVRAFDDPYAAAAGCAAVVVLQDGLAPDRVRLDRLGAVVPGALLVDCWNAFRPADVRAAGLRHVVLGRAAA